METTTYTLYRNEKRNSFGEEVATGSKRVLLCGQLGKNDDLKRTCRPQPLKSSITLCRTQVCPSLAQLEQAVNNDVECDQSLPRYHSKAAREITICGQAEL